MSDQMLTQVKVDGTTITAGTKIKKWRFDGESEKSISQVVITATRNMTADVTLEIGLDVEVWRGWGTTTVEKIFSGKIEHHSI